MERILRAKSVVDIADPVDTSKVCAGIMEQQRMGRGQGGGGGEVAEAAQAGRVEIVGQQGVVGGSV